LQGYRFPDQVSGHLLVVTLTLAGTVLDAEASGAHERWDVCLAERLGADSTEILVVQRPLLEAAHLSVRHAVRFVIIFVRGHVL
jgi:hypothetical protein